MKMNFITIIGWLAIFAMILSGCQPVPASPSGAQQEQASTDNLRVLASTSFLSDIAQNVAGERLLVESLIPLGIDPHAFHPTPRDVAKIAESDILIVNGMGFEEWLEETLHNVGGERLVIEAAMGLTMRELGEEELGLHHDDHDHHGDHDDHDDHGDHDDHDHHGDHNHHHHHDGDPHFWLDPLNVIQYVENIRDGFIQADPEGEAIYTQNAADYIEQLRALHSWIEDQVSLIPPERRLLVTNHESFGYFADRYGFRIIGTIIPSVSTGASPSAQDLARLVDDIRSAGITAIFLETGANPQLAQQLSQEIGVRVITDLYTHSLTPPGGNAPSYIEMMKYNTTKIIDALQ